MERGLIKATNSGENFEGWVVGFYGEWSDTLAKLPEKLADAQVVRWQSKYGREPTIQQRAWLVSKVRSDIATVWRTKRSTEKSRFRASDGCRGPKGRGSRCEAARAAIRFGGQVREDVLKCTIAPGFCPKGGPEVGLIFPLLSLSLFPPPLIPHPPISAQSWEPGCKVYVTGT